VLVFREIDRDVSAWTPDSLRAAYIRHGCAVVRGAIDVGTIEKVRAVTADIFSRISDVHVFEPQISEATQGRVSGFDLIAHPTLRRFLDLVYVSQCYRRGSATARRIKGRESNADWQEPLELHVDSYFHAFWFTDKPPACNGRYFPDEGLNIARVEADFGTGSSTSTISPISHSRLVTFAAISGVVRSVLSLGRWGDRLASRCGRNDAEAPLTQLVPTVTPEMAGKARGGTARNEEKPKPAKAPTGAAPLSSPTFSTPANQSAV
jgi:hypothetical protein